MPLQPSASLGRSCIVMGVSFVMRGLDPRIHPFGRRKAVGARKRVGPRLKAAGDNCPTMAV